ncbi:ribosome small subunit-dependent GTPase A [Bombilactobacillus bombi]|uniref:Small ribosomal subunit biogenesis GTPase RsgA n=1 Tax=Bombilactobacillus bombi TaxID=1303590 RepID=A0A3R6YL81_9LACO|nr:ribosome small subunit-dependent GTPase A [Bombilactobacillus bombi]RHW49642.1 ribosome small subunit-dependent GTPase A [Bombilactobacillus bombi]
MQTGKIIKSNSGFYDVQTANQEIIRTRARGNFRQKKIKPIVGDWVEFENDYLLKIKPRKNEVVRPLIANVDQALVVITAVEPQFSTNLLDRFLVVLTAQKIKPLIYLSKIDLTPKQQQTQLIEQLKYYQSCGYQVFISNEVKQNPQSLIAALDNKETVLAGQTGAGKSTLLNHLIPNLNLETGSISTSLNRGKHTTRMVTLYSFHKGLIADTPGFSSLTLQNITRENLPQLFPDFVSLKDKCKYRSCVHLNEPDCAVKQAVDSGKIMNSRYLNYCQFQAEIAQERPVYLKTDKRSKKNNG